MVGKFARTALVSLALAFGGVSASPSCEYKIAESSFAENGTIVQLSLTNTTSSAWAVGKQFQLDLGSPNLLDVGFHPENSVEIIDSSENLYTFQVLETPNDSVLQMIAERDCSESSDDDDDDQDGSSTAAATCSTSISVVCEDGSQDSTTPAAKVLSVKHDDADDSEFGPLGLWHSRWLRKRHRWGRKRHGWGHKRRRWGHKRHGWGHKRHGWGHKPYGKYGYKQRHVISRIAKEHTTMTLECPSGQSIRHILFASYGLPLSFTKNPKCHATGSRRVVSQKCLGKSRCVISASNSLFEDPCYGTFKRLAVRASCARGRPIESRRCRQPPNHANTLICPANVKHTLVRAASCNGKYKYASYIPAHRLWGFPTGAFNWEWGRFTEKSNGQAEVTGVLFNGKVRFEVYILLKERQFGEHGVNPYKTNDGKCASFDTSSWYFYRHVSGWMWNLKTWKKFSLSNAGTRAAQIGTFANVKNGNRGLAFWLKASNGSGPKAGIDFNSDIVCKS